MKTRKVPLVVYKNGERKVIGEAVVDTDGDYFDVTGVVTDPEYQKAISGDAGGLSLNSQWRGGNEVAYIPPPETPKGPFTIKGHIPKN